MTKKNAFYHFISIILVLSILAGCGLLKKIPVFREFLGERINTTVDSYVARYYLENYLQGYKSNPDLDKKIDNLYIQQQGLLPTREELKSISHEYSVDFAAIFLADRLWADEGNRKAQDTFNSFLNNENRNLAALSNINKKYMVLFVPGWDYIDNGHITGADFAEPRKLVTKLGIENYLVDIPPNESVENNADYITNYLVKHGQTEKEIIIVGASSAGPAIHLSLSRGNGKLDNNIKAWVNLGGILRGSPLIDYYQKWPRSIVFNIAVWYKGWDKEKILSMSVKNSRKRFENLGHINNNILVINYLGLSLSGQLSKYAKDNYPLIAPEGPNDGLTLLSDIIAPNSFTIIALASDHFFAEDPRINEKTVALTNVVISYLEQNITPSIPETKISAAHP